MIIVDTEYNNSTGLGNKLFPWSRAKILSHEMGYKMLQQIWISPKGGAITRGGIDYSKALRKIWLLSNFKNGDLELSLISYFLKSRKLRKFLVSDLVEAFQIKQNNSLIKFKWDTCHNFTDLQGKQQIILNDLREITKIKELKKIEQYLGTDFIGLNIRTGNDFKKYSPNINGYLKTDLQWYKDALKTIRRNYGDLQVLVVSDGGRKELQTILDEPRTILVNNDTAIADLLLLTKANVLLGSGNSSFSAWASFLGEMDTYSAPETPFTKFQINCKHPKQIVSII